MGVAHERWLVVLSLVVAIQGAYVGLSLAVQVGDSMGMRRRLLLAASAISLAVAIWSMHFVAMLAVRLPFPIDYLVFPTLLSFLVCVIVVGAAVFAASARPPTAVRLAASAVFMGGGIATMHYIGMAALHASAHMDHAPLFVVASVAISMATSALALWLANGRGGRPPLLLSAVALGTAIAGMHYTAMAGLTLTPFAIRTPGAPALSSDLLAIVVAIVAFIVSGIFLLALVPERSKTSIQRSSAERAIERETISPGVAGAESDHESTGGRAAFGPLGGAGAPRRRTVERLPVEREGITQFVPVDDIVAVHANAHYTYVFDGKHKLFCPLAISAVEARLDKARFIRVHRSHIVNVDRIVGLKRAGDTGLIELAALDPYTVPVSRSRLGWLKSHLGLKSGDTSRDHPMAAAEAAALAAQHR